MYKASLVGGDMMCVLVEWDVSARRHPRRIQFSGLPRLTPRSGKALLFFKKSFSRALLFEHEVGRGQHVPVIDGLEEWSGR